MDLKLGSPSLCVLEVLIRAGSVDVLLWSRSKCVITFATGSYPRNSWLTCDCFVRFVERCYFLEFASII